MKSFVVCFVIVMAFPSWTRAELRMTEVYPAPESGNYEWVELYNDGPDPIDLTRHSIFDLTGRNVAINELVLHAQEYAIATSSGVINNSGDTLFLKNADGVVVQTVTTPRDISSTQSFVLCGVDWIVSSLVSQKSSNEKACVTPSPTVKPSSFPTQKPTEAPITVPSGIYISEAMVYPEKNAFEWVELYNSTPESVTLLDWQIDDEAGGSKPVKFTIILPAHSYKVISLTSAIFNNSSDEVRLLDPTGRVVDSMSYSSSQQGLSISKAADGSTVCVTIATPEQENMACPDATDEIYAQAEEGDVSALTTTTAQSSSLSQSPTQFSLSKLQPAISPAKKTALYTGKIYSLEEVPKPPFFSYAQTGTLSCLLSCALHFMYSMYRYKHIYV